MIGRGGGWFVWWPSVNAASSVPNFEAIEGNLVTTPFKMGGGLLDQIVIRTWVEHFDGRDVALSHQKATHRLSPLSLQVLPGI